MELKQEEMKTRMYLNIAKPASLPELKSPSVTPKPSLPPKQNQLPIVGKIKSNKVQKRPLVISNSVKKKNETEEEFVEEEDEDEDEPPEKCAREDPTPRLQEKQLDGPSSRSQQTKSSSSQELGKNEQKSTSSQISQEFKNVSVPKLKDTVSLTDNPKVKLKIESDSSTKKEIQPELPHKKDKETTRPKTEGKITGDYNSTDPDYAVWIPPSDQTGDGKTSLNEKFGY